MKRTSIKDLIRKKKRIVFPRAYNPFIARLIENAGFDGIYISGAGLSNSLGVPDDGTLQLEAFLYFAKKIVEAVRIPVICDADTGFDNIEITVEKYIETGLAGLHIEDQVLPKRCGHIEGKEVITSKKMVEKIKKAVRIRDEKKPDFLIIARTDARGANNIDEDIQLSESIDRGRVYLDAGADMIFPESLRDKDEFRQYKKEVGGWLLANMTEFGKTPFIRHQEFKEIGYNIVIFPVTLFRFAAGRTLHALNILKKNGDQEELIDLMMNRNDINKLLNYFPERRK